MKVHIQLTTWFKKYANGKSDICVELDEVETEADVSISVDVGGVSNLGTSTNTCPSVKRGFTARDAIIAAGIPENEIGVITKDGSKIAEDSYLNDGDKIKIFTTILGG